MINVNLCKNEYTYFTVGQLKTLLGRHQAFVASYDDEEELFLITSLGIVLMKDPHQTWSKAESKFKVKRFVNLNVNTVEK